MLRGSILFALFVTPIFLCSTILFAHAQVASPATPPKSVSETISEAEELIKADKLDPAWRLLTKTQEQLPATTTDSERRILQSTMAKVLRLAGDFYRKEQRYPEARHHYLGARDLYRGLSERFLEANVLLNLGITQAVQDGIEGIKAARISYEEAQRIFQELHEKALVNIGNMDAAMGQMQRALAFYKKALPLLREAKNRPFEANALYNMGKVYFDLKRFSDAATHFEECLPVAREVGNSPVVIGTVEQLGITYERLGLYDRATQYLREALPLCRNSKNTQAEARIRGTLGRIYENTGELNRALEEYGEALILFRKLEDQRYQGGTLVNLGNVYEQLARYDRALECFHQALPLLNSIESREFKGNALCGVGNVHLSLSQAEQALSYFEQALILFQAVNHREYEAKAFAGIGHSYQSRKLTEKALLYYQKALAIHKERGDIYGETGVLVNIGNLHKLEGSHAAARQTYEQVLERLVHTPDSFIKADTLNNIGLTYASQSDFPKAITFYQRALPIYRKTGQRREESLTLHNLTVAWGALRNVQRNREIAILFGKMSVNFRQEIREQVSGAKDILQRSTLQDDAPYSLLARLLLDSGRFAEARQVVTLYKASEYAALLLLRGKNSGQKVQTPAEIAAQRAILTPKESNIVARYEKLSDEVGRLGREAKRLEWLQERTSTVRTAREHIVCSKL
jgi:tetratricopeptide (TPR) repeat protein